jgi:choline dehydrogenase
MKYDKNDEKFYIDFFENLDYIVIGSGPGGCAVSKILTDDGNSKVFMIEAGYDQDNNHLINQSYNAPLLEELYYPNFFWIVNQVHQNNAPELSANYTNGRLYGGGSSVNGEQYVKGTSKYYEKISKEFNDDDWSWKSIKNIFDKNFGKDKLISIRKTPYLENKAGRKIVDGMVNVLNVKEIEDYNSFEKDYEKDNGVFTQWQYYQNEDGTRCSSSTSILKKDLYMKDNFIIIDKSTVVKILFKDNKAIGVIYCRNGVSKEVYCKKSVILSAGTQTNVLLQTSGIGPLNILKQNNIDIVVDSPKVGTNLYNHLIVYTTINIDINDSESKDQNALYSFGGFLADDNTIDRSSEWIGINNNDGTMGIVLLQLNPKSDGYCKVQSNDYLTTPLVSEAAFGDQEDSTWFIDLLKNKFAPLVNYLNKENSNYSFNSPSQDTFIGTDEEVNQKLNDFIQSGNLEHAHHWTAQCSIGKNINEGVVGSNGKVYGCEGLYVADTSIFPYPYDGNTAGLAYITGFVVGKKILAGT